VLGHNRIAIIHDTNDYGTGGMRLVSAHLRSRGIEPVLIEGFSTGTRDFAPPLIRIRAANAQAIIVWCNFTEGAQLVRQIRELGIPGEVLLATGVTIGNFFELAGDAADNLYGITSGYSPMRTDPEALAFIQRFSAAMGYTPDVNNVLAYDAMIVLGKAIADAGSTDNVAIRDALRRIQGFPALSGPISFLENGEGGTQSLIFRIDNGVVSLVNN
jgi:branched-chain amino acid transport system substrate-binding protein